LFRVEVQKVEKDSASPFCRSGRSSAAQMSEVSISWWMSQPMQSFLDRQLCRKENSDALDQTMRVSAAAEAADAPADPSACKAP
jgi:hypothetical protein